jgi:hypothetical protein
VFVDARPTACVGCEETRDRAPPSHIVEMRENHHIDQDGIDSMVFWLYNAPPPFSPPSWRRRPRGSPHKLCTHSRGGLETHLSTLPFPTPRPLASETSLHSTEHNGQ